MTSRPVSKRQQRKRAGFKKGRESPLKGKKVQFTSKKSCTYVRLNRETFNSRIDSSEGMLTVRDVDSIPTGVRLLRPLSSRSRPVDEYIKPDDTTIHPDLMTSRLYCPKMVQDMFNSEIRNHIVNTKCLGSLNFDAKSSRKWGLAWAERLKCTKCDYLSAYYKLYTEIEAKKRGRKAAGVNVGFQLGLMTTPLSTTGARRLLVNAEIEPPAGTSMQKMANQVGSKIQELNLQNMHEIRENLKVENEKCGYKSKSAVRTESDSCYNNRIFNADSTPFQAGTIVATTVCENNTSNKQVIGVHVGVKLCPTASRLQNQGKQVKCPSHPGHCTANLKQSEAIGNEQAWNEIVSKQIGKDLRIVCNTSDGDSKGHTGIQKGQGGRFVLPLKDIRHLSNSLKREIMKAPFSSFMFKGKNKSNLRSRFALSVKTRCIAELRKAHEVYKGNLKQIQTKMPNIIAALVSCFQGQCDHMCRKYSLVCKGNNKRECSYLSNTVKPKLTGYDSSVLTKCVEILLGHDNLEKTKFQTSTQKCEAVNRAYQGCMPKSTTFSRNCHGRLHGQILRLNHGHADSMILKSKAVNLKLSKGSAVMRHLLKIDEFDQRRKSNAYKHKARQSRYAARRRRFKMHAELHYKQGVSDPKPNYLLPSTSGLTHP